MLLDFIMILLGLVGLFYGADWLVKGAARLAFLFGIPSLVIGLTVVSFGTSMPEQVVSLTAVFRDSDAISVGNVVGSNIANVALILGLTSLIVPITVHAQLIRREIPLMIGISVLTYGFASSGVISRIEGIILFIGIILFTYASYHSATTSTDEELQDEAEEFDEVEELLTDEVNSRAEIMRLLAGLVVLLIAAQLTVEGATGVARSFGVSDIVIGLTLVAFGTSLPELATSMVAAIRKESDISVGNIVGSNIFNLLSILGITSMVHPLHVPDVTVKYDFPIMIGVSLLLLPFSMRRPFGRWQGVVFLSIYFGYTFYLFLR